jgi:hypothetical protein
MLFAILLANLPRRWWGPFEERYPLHRFAWLAGLATMGVGVGLGISGYIRFVAAAADGMNRALIAAQSDLVQLPGWGLLALPAFLFTTPLGLLSLYLTGSGFVRAIAAYLADDVRGDFLLTVVDAGVRRIAGRTRASRETRAREHLEGPDVADRLLTGAQVRRPELEFVLLAARRKPEWLPNAYLVAADGTAYRIGVPFDFQSPGGLRTAYPLTTLRGGEAIRHAIAYELPARR